MSLRVKWKKDSQRDRLCGSEITQGGKQDRKQLAGSWNENGPIANLNAWPPVGGTVWEGLGGVALLEKMCHWGWALRFLKLTPFPVSALLA